MGIIPTPKFDVKGSRRAASQIADRMSTGHKHALVTLNLHIERTGYMDRAQAYLMQAKMQLRRSERDDADALGVDKYQCAHYGWDYESHDEQQKVLDFGRFW
jgi:hypothetical protein